MVIRYRLEFYYNKWNISPFQTPPHILLFHSLCVEKMKKMKWNEMCWVAKRRKHFWLAEMREGPHRKRTIGFACSDFDRSGYGAAGCIGSCKSRGLSVESLRGVYCRLLWRFMESYVGWRVTSWWEWFMNIYTNINQKTTIGKSSANSSRSASQRSWDSMEK